MGQLRTILILGRVSNLPTVWSNVMAAWFLAQGDWNIGLAWLILGGSLVYVGGMTLNDAFDAQWDKEHAKPRPIAQGKIGVNDVWILGIVWMIGGLVALVMMGHAYRLWVAALILAIVLYNAIHKQWAGSMWIMGGCRLLLYITAASALQPMPGREVWIWGTTLLVYVAGITLAARGENTGGAVKKLALVLLCAPVLVGVVEVILSIGKFAPYLLEMRIGFILVLAGWLALSYRKLKQSDGNVGKFVASLLAGMVLIDAIALSSLHLPAAALCAALLLVNLLLQRFVPAT